MKKILLLVVIVGVVAGSAYAQDNSARIMQLEHQKKRLQEEVLKLQQQMSGIDQELARLKSATVVTVTTPVGENAVRVQVKVEYIERCAGIPKPSVARNFIMAEQVARMDAMRNLAGKCRGMWIAAWSESTNGEGTSEIVGKLEPTKMMGFRYDRSILDHANGMVTVPIRIGRSQIIQSISKSIGRDLSPEEYEDIRYMFPEEVTATGRGSWKEEGRRQAMALYGAQLDARRLLVEQLRGVLVECSSRMEDFVMKEDRIVTTIETTLLVGLDVVDEKVGGGIAESTVEIKKYMYIYSVRKGMESNGEKLSPEEYQELRNMLTEKTYRFTGKAAVQ